MIERDIIRISVLGETKWRQRGIYTVEPENPKQKSKNQDSINWQTSRKNEVEKSAAYGSRCKDENGKA